MHNAKVLEIMNLEKSHRKKKKPRSYLKAFVLNFFLEVRVLFPSVSFKTKTKTQQFQYHHT